MHNSIFLYSCSECLQTDNACGWCVYDKVCSGTSAPCVNGTDNFLQVCDLLLVKGMHLCTEVCAIAIYESRLH